VEGGLHQFQMILCLSDLVTHVAFLNASNSPDVVFSIAKPAVYLKDL